MQLFVKILTGNIIRLPCEENETIQSLKEKIFENTGIPLTSQRLIFAGKELQNEKTVSDCNIPNDCTIYLVSTKPKQNAPKKPVDLTQLNQTQIFCEGTPLAVVNRRLVVNELPTIFKLHHKKLWSGATVFGFENQETKEYLFSSPAGQGLFHGQYGGYQVYCRYPYFSFGEEFLIHEDNKVQCCRNGYFWKLKDGKISITKERSDASIFEIRPKENVM